MSDSAVHDHRAATLALLDRLIRRGRELRTRFTQNPQNPQNQLFSESSAPAEPKLGEVQTSGGWSSAMYVNLTADVRIWQYDCAAAVNELSGGSKAHWLSRAYSAALLVRSAAGDAITEASVADIVTRVIDVLEQGRRSIAEMDAAAAPSGDTPPQPHRFDFVHDAQLRPVLEQAFVDSGRAHDEGDFERALKTCCGILEAIITDALRCRAGLSGPRDIEMSFDERIAAAEAAGLIRGGCARLPPLARAYRDASSDDTVSERDARTARQVLAVVMRDLEPGR